MRKATQLPRLDLARMLMSALLLAASPCGCSSRMEVDESPAKPRQENESSLADEAAAVVAQRKQLDRTIWAEELLAQRYESTIVNLWDRLRAAEDKLAVLADVPLETIKLGKEHSRESRGHGIQVIRIAPHGRQRLRADWIRMVGEYHAAGYRLIQSEWHHARFEYRDGQPRSTVNIALHVTNDSKQERLVIRAELVIDWGPSAVASEGFPPRHVELSSLQIQRREGQVPFRLAATLPARDSAATDFIAAYDLDADGLSEIVFGNKLFRNLGGGNYQADVLSPHREDRLNSAVLADFSGDGHTDLLCADPNSQPTLYIADKEGRFSQPPRIINLVDPIALSMSITAGDVNGDGHLDVWLSQYKRPYVDGQMPTPYFDANDGYPSYLLINQVDGTFRDATEKAGLGKKRFRRTYSSSLVDLDGDSDLDLLVVSDFAGIDIYRNHGDGLFEDVTERWLDEWHNFGMSHALADFDGDGNLDLFVTGMGSTTARRLEAMGLKPSGRGEATRMRTIMGYGNRMYLARQDGFRQPDFNDQVARTGWSWGVTSFDFDNDGDRDIYVGNGHISGPSAEDYCSVFWRHDIYTDGPQPNPVLEKVFFDVHHQFQQRGSWNGYEHNSLLMNEAGQGFLEVGFLLGVASEFDTRSVISDDVDGDGLMDLLAIEKPRGRPATLHVMKNHFERAGHWIGVTLTDQPGRSAIGASVTVHTEAGTQIARIVNGDSFNCQHASAVHFGLGERDRVDRVEVQWLDGTQQVIRGPKIGQYHTIRAPLNGRP